MKTESQFQTLFKHFLESHPPRSTETYELKLVKKGPFPFAVVKDHQIEGLVKSKEGLYIKLSDTAAMNGFASPKPFDCLWVKAYEAWVVVLFYFPRKDKVAIKIPVKRFLQIRDTWPRKSIHFKELENLSGIEKVVI